VTALDGRLVGAMLFDMDGTLVDSEPSGDRCWVRWTGEVGITDLSFMQHYYGRQTREVLAELLPPAEIDAAVARILELKMQDAVTVRALPGARDLLDSLPERHRAIVTSAGRELADARLLASGIVPPTVFVTGELTDRGKPEPEPFLLGARLLDVDPVECVAVEDTPAGIASARAAGMTVIGVQGTFPASGLDADVVVDGLDAVTASVVEGGVLLHLDAARVLRAG
jgi:sugar-phosphatase